MVSKYRHKTKLISGIAAILLLGSAVTAAYSQDKITLRLFWWGSEARNTATIAAAELFEQKYPNIDVQAEPLPFDGYFDKLSTEFAANSAPDVMQLTEDFVGQFGSVGALLPIDKVDTSQLVKATTETVMVDGQLLGVPTSVGTSMVVANKTLFDAAGVPLPDDATWTWDDFVDLSIQISEKSPDGVFGSQPLGLDGPSFLSFLRQQGGAGFTADGAVGFTAEQVVPYFEMAKELADRGGSGGPEKGAEMVSLPLEQSGVATNTAAMGFWASTQFSALTAASGQELIPLMLPSAPGHPGDNKMSIGSGTWSIFARTAHPDEAQMLVDFLVNDPEAGKILMLTRGTPPSAKVREAIAPDLKPSDVIIGQFIDRLSPTAVSVPLPPPGFGVFQDTFRRYAAEYMFGRMSAQDAAQALVDEMKLAVGK